MSLNLVGGSWPLVRQVSERESCAWIMATRLSSQCVCVSATDAIPAAQGQSLSLQKTRPLRESDGVVISPRMSKLRKKTK